MRFIFGLIIGAATTLMLASVLSKDASTQLQPIYEQAKQWLGEWRTAAANDNSAAPVAQRPATLPSPSPATARPEKIPPESAAAEALAEQIVDAAPAPIDLLVADQTNQLQQDNEPEELAPANNGDAVVWSPFHSEASASGFARRLSSQLDHPFQVVKQRPAHYVVTYQFKDAAEQQALETQIAAITGSSP